MTTINEITMDTNTLVQDARGPFVPMFVSGNMEQPMADDAKTQKKPDISLFDVKELYDRAYAEESQDQERFKKILAEAVKLDLAYRRQLTKNTIYKDTTKVKNFKTATDGSKVA